MSDQSSFSSSQNISSSKTNLYTLCRGCAGSAAQARMADSYAIQTIGIPSLVLMENAAQAMCSRLGDKDHQLYLILCGPGNNGADGLAMARILHEQGCKVLIFAGKAAGAEQETQLRIVNNLGIPICDLGWLQTSGFINCLETFAEISAADVQKLHPAIIDGLFGSGLSRPVEGLYADCIRLCSTSGWPIYSIDIASGLNGTTGEVASVCMKAAETFALDCYKTGALIGEGPLVSGKQVLCDIGIPGIAHEKAADWMLIDEKVAAALLPVRSNFDNKGNFGKVLMAVGSRKMQGAACMAAKACFHAGCGTLTLYSPADAADALRSKLSTAMILNAPQDENGFFSVQAVEHIEKILAPFSQLACGSGIGRESGSLQIAEVLLSSDKPLVLDADGLSVLAGQTDKLDRQAPLVITPHLKEFSVLTGTDFDQVLSDPFGCAEQFAAEHPNVVLVLKSDFTLIIQGQRKAIVYRPSSALSKGGSGDVLCGLITGLCAWFDNPFEAACVGVWVHNAASQNAESSISFSPEDLIGQFGIIFRKLNNL